MRRVVALFLLTATAARADRMPDYQPEVRAAVADVCVIGTVTEVEKEPVQAKPYPGATDPIPFTVAVVKVETAVQGAKNVTHVRVGFIPAAPGLQRYPQPSLKVDQKVCLFLNKHPDAAIHLMPALSPPLDVSDATKDAIARIRRMAPVFADPLKALKADKAEDRAFAAAALLVKYRHPRFVGVPQAEVAIPADESKAILAALAEGDWTHPGALSPLLAVQHLNLTKADGFALPQAQPGQDVAKLMKAEFNRWVAAEGAKYTIKKLEPKTK